MDFQNKCYIRFIFIFISILLGVLNIFAFENNFFRCDFPGNWSIRHDSGHVPLMEFPYELNIFMNSKEEKDCSQFFYSFISKQTPNPKDVIYEHIERKLDNEGLESLCSYSEEDFHGYRALKYSFCGKLFGPYGRGIAYAFRYNGHILLFVSFFAPDVLEGRIEYDVWNKLEILDKGKWKFEF